MEYLKLMRIKHYIKNFLIFLPLFFSKEIINNVEKLLYVFIGFLSFCFVSSIVYIINDIFDAPKDRLHETKKYRPIASGKVSVKNAIVLIIVLIFLSSISLIFVGNFLNYFGIIYVLIYLTINFLYSFGLKNVPIVDVAILVSGFLIRLMFGGFLATVEISNWLYLTVMSMAFYLGLGKRRNELIKNGSETRGVLKYYTKNFLDKNMYMFLAITIVFYALWCNANVNSYIIWTVPIVILILLKYNMNIEKDTYGDPIEIIYSDKVILLLSLVVGLIIIAGIYL